MISHSVEKIFSLGFICHRYDSSKAEGCALQDMGLNYREL